MLFKKKQTRNWMDYLNDEDRLILLDLISSTRKYRHAYSKASNSRIAQLWTALIELKKEMNEHFKHIRSARIKTKSDMETIAKETIRRADRTNEDSTNKLVESLMRF
ncbi:MAG: hypothetical protein HYW22_02650 [Candidatus Aenigmarchaeota archaeon]|nr:hypothetical protein [Candidatus Aenigmarchaeota archaeon]